jgi:hypothetical protein
MSRYYSKEDLKQMDDEVYTFFNEKQKTLDAIKIPDFAKIRKKDGYYKGKDPEGIVSLSEMKSFWKIPDSAGDMLDSMANRAKLFVGGYTGGLAGVGSAVATGVQTEGGIEEYLSTLVDFSDSDASLDKDDPSGLYYYLTKDEQEQWSKDEDWQNVSQYGSMIFGTLSGQPEIMMASANKGTRETMQEALGMRHTDLLKNAIKRRNADLTKQAEITAFKERSTEALEDLKDDFAQADLQSDLYVKKMSGVMNDVAVRSSGHAYNLPVYTTLPSTGNIPANMMKGRGLGEMLIPETEMWHRKAFGTHKRKYKDKYSHHPIVVY